MSFLQGKNLTLPQCSGLGSKFGFHRHSDLFAGRPPNVRVEGESTGNVVPLPCSVLPGGGRVGQEPPLAGTLGRPQLILCRTRGVQGEVWGRVGGGVGWLALTLLAVSSEL